MTPDPLPVALPELTVVARQAPDHKVWCARLDPDGGPCDCGAVRADLVRKSDAEAALRAQADEVAALRAAIDKIRQSVSPKGPRPCDCERCDCHNSGSWAQVVAWDEAASMVAAIDVHLAASKQEKPHG